MIPADWAKVPGAGLVSSGLEDLRQGVVSHNALLVLIGRPRLEWLGITVPDTVLPEGRPELALYEQLRASGRRDAHTAYNGLIARLVSFERELERRLFRARRLQAQRSR